MARRKHRGMKLGAAPDVHAYQARMALNLTADALGKVDREVASKTPDCNKIWDNLLVARADLGHAMAHLDSYEASKDLMGYASGLRIRFERTRETIGFQCTRRRGGIR